MNPLNSINSNRHCIYLEEMAKDTSWGLEEIFIIKLFLKSKERL